MAKKKMGGRTGHDPTGLSGNVHKDLKGKGGGGHGKKGNTGHDPTGLKGRVFEDMMGRTADQSGKTQGGVE